jgi:hypothetical protein
LFTSYKDQGNQSNVLTCDSVTNLCTLPIRGAVHSSSFDVQSNQHNKLGLDFSLKDFKVADFGLPTCAVTMKVSPLNASDMKKKGSQEAARGTVSALDTTAKTFLLTKGTMVFSVFYAGISDAAQPGLDLLLAQAEADGVRVMVMTDSIDLETKIIDASSVSVKIKGTVSALNTKAHTFTLTYGASAKMLSASYSSPSDVDGKIADAVKAKVKLYGYDGVTQEYLATHVEVVSTGAKQEDEDDDDNDDDDDDDD